MKKTLWLIAWLCLICSQALAQYTQPVALVAKTPTGENAFILVDANGNLYTSGAPGIAQAPLGYLNPVRPQALGPDGQYHDLLVDANGNLQTTSNGGGGAAWGSITGTLANQTDLNNALAAKQNSLGYTAENTANKSTNTSLGSSDTAYPSQNAVKTYVDAHAASAVQQLAEPATPVVGQVGLNTTNNDFWVTTPQTDNASSPNNLYSTSSLGKDHDNQNLWILQQTNKAFAGIEKNIAGSYFVWLANGDSNTGGISTTMSMVNEIANMMQGPTGWGNAGPGYLSVATAKNPLPNQSFTFTSSGSWTTCSWTTGVISNGHSGACWGLDDADVTATATAGDFVKWHGLASSLPFTDCFIYYALVSGGGSFKSNLDGSDGGTVSTNGTGVGSVACPHGSTGIHDIQAIATTTGSPITILGAIAINATNGTGALVLKAGGASNTAANFALNPNFAALVAKIQTDLSGLSNFATGISLFSQQWGANEWTQNLTPVSMQTAMTTLDAAYAASGANADFLIISDNDDGLGGATNSLGFSMWQYDYAHQQFATRKQYAFFSTFRRTYPARASLCGTLHLASTTCQRMIATTLLQRMIGHTTNPNRLVNWYDSDTQTYSPANAATAGCTGAVSAFTPDVDSNWRCWVDASQTVADAGCTQHASVGFGLNWKDAFSGSTVQTFSTGSVQTNNMFETAANATTFSTSSVATLAAVASLTAGQIWTGVPKHIRASAGSPVQFCAGLTTAPTNCTTQPTYKYRVFCKQEQ